MQSSVSLVTPTWRFGLVGQAVANASQSSMDLSHKHPCYLKRSAVSYPLHSEESLRISTLLGSLFYVMETKMSALSVS